MNSEAALLQTGVIVVLLVLVICFIMHIRLTMRLARSLDGPKRDAEIDRALRDMADDLRKSQFELDQGLRAAIGAGMRDGLTTAFRHVQDGNLAHAAELARFGNVLNEDFGLVKNEVGTLSDKVATALAGITNLLGERLSSAETAAADGRADLLRETTGAILHAREQIDLSMKSFGAEQEARLVRLDVAVRDGGTAVQNVLEAFKKLVIERVVLASEATEGALREFGHQQGQRLEGIALTVKTGGEASQASLGQFRKEVADRLDAVSGASSSLLEKSAATFTEIKAAVVASEEKTGAALNEQRVAVLERLTVGHLDISEKLTLDLGSLTKVMADNFEGFSAKFRAEQETLRGLVGTKLEEMRAGNETKLEEMRKAVDEKLQTALEKQVGESFQRIAEQFAAVQQAIGQVQSVAGQVGDLKRLFSNVKSRGGWGEAQAEAMLQDMLPVGAYEKNMKVREGSSEFVEFAVRVPGKSDAVRWISIDSKFPTGDYERLLNANEQGNREDELAARTGLERRIRLEAERIASKYIVAPKTVDFAVLYLPSDSLFAEVARSPGLLELVRRDHKIIVMGPSLLPAFLHTINVGYLTMAIEQNATEIGETLGAVKAEWGKLLPWLDKLSDRTESLKKGIEEVQKRARAVGRKLRTVDVIDHSRAEAVLGLDGSSNMDADEDEMSPANVKSDVYAQAG